MPTARWSSRSRMPSERDQVHRAGRLAIPCGRSADTFRREHQIPGCRMKSERQFLLAALVVAAVVVLGGSRAQAGRRSHRIRADDLTGSSRMAWSKVYRNVVAVSGDLELRSTEAVRQPHRERDFMVRRRSGIRCGLSRRPPSSMRQNERGARAVTCGVRRRGGPSAQAGCDTAAISVFWRIRRRDGEGRFLRSSMTGLSMAFNDSTRNGMVSACRRFVARTTGDHHHTHRRRYDLVFQRRRPRASGIK